MTRHDRPKQTTRSRSAEGSDTSLRIAHAMAALDHGRILAGQRSLKLSARVDPGLLEAARKRSGIEGDSDLVNAALALMAAPDDFGAWLVSRAGTLSEDFEIAV